MKRKNLIALLLVILLLIEIVPLYKNDNKIVYADVQVVYNGQTTTGIYSISTIEQLAMLASKVNSGITYAGSTFILQNDIILDSSMTNNYTPIGIESAPFMGKFDGGGYAVSGLNTKAVEQCGFFGYIKNSEVKNLTVTNSLLNYRVINAKTNPNAGSISGFAENSYIINCSSLNNIFKHINVGGSHFNNRVGGIVGSGVNINVDLCSSQNISLNSETGYTSMFGGIVGYLNKGVVTNSSNYSNIVYIYYTVQIVGGIVAYSEDSIKISNCSNYGNLYGNQQVGGIVGYIHASNVTISKCFNTGEINSRIQSVGGIVGYSYYTNGVIELCYNKGPIKVNYEYGSGGGILGQNIYNGTQAFAIKNCYNAGTVNNPTVESSLYPRHYYGAAVGGIVGEGTGIAISNSYNIGNITGGYFHYEAGEAEGEYYPGDTYYRNGGLRGYYTSSCVTLNSYYLDTSSARDFGQYQENKYSGKLYAKTSAYLKSTAILELINSENAYIADTQNINNGFPIFKWQLQIQDVSIIGNTTLEKDSYATLTTKINPEEILPDDIKYTWEIENPEIISRTSLLDNKGAILKGLKKGTTILHISATYNGKTITKKIPITVVNPAVQTKEGYYLLGEEIEYLTSYNDDDNDPKYRDEFKYNHFPNRLEIGVNLDNTLGIINYNDKWLGDSVKTFGKVGAYEVSYRVQDNPPTANKLGFENYRYYSQAISTTIYIHRKPIAWFNIENNKINDNSYDLDHSVSYTNKGIVKWEWTYINDKGKIFTYLATDKSTGINTVNNWLSSNLGVNYELILRVQDMELAWSDVYSTKIKGEINFSANLRTELEKFDLVTGVPASENILAFDIWTRYTDELRLELVLCDTTGKEVAPALPVKYSSSTATKIGQDTYWNDVLYNIPVKLKSDKYIMKIKAIDERNSDVFKEIPFNVNVKTPIDLQPTMPSEIRAGKETQIYAKTSKYVNSAYAGSGVKVTLFYGTSHAQTLTLDGTHTNWSKLNTLSKTIPAGNYTARFIATLPSGDYEFKDLSYKYVINTPPVITDSMIYAESGGDFIYENDDVNLKMRFHDDDLSNLSISVKLYKSDNLTVPIRTYLSVVSQNGGKYDDYTIRLIDDIPIGGYKVVATVTDDYDETAILTKDFTAHDLWVNGTVTHTADWEKNRQTYNSKYPGKSRDADIYWNGEELVTSAETTEINVASNVVCAKVSVEIINKDKPSDKKYLQWMNADNIANDIWSLGYWDKEWVSKDGYVINKWGADKKQELTLRFTAYFNNGWVETSDVIIYIDNRDDYWKLHRAW